MRAAAIEPTIVGNLQHATVRDIAELLPHLEQRGRRAIMWGDALLGDVARRIVIADWHYDATSGDVPTLASLRARGYETLRWS